MDITWCVERRSTGAWGRAEQFGPPVLPVDRLAELEPTTWYAQRDYFLFRLLVGIRQPQVLPRPRGLPDDISPITRKQYHRLQTDNFYASYLTIAELLAVPWRQRVAVEHAIEDRYIDGRPGRAKAMLDALARFDRWPKAPQMPPAPNTVDETWQDHTTVITLERPLSELVDASFMSCLVWMASVSNGRLDGVRAVFWFDEPRSDFDEDLASNVSERVAWDFGPVRR